MPNISKITLPNNLTYDIKDAAARNDISSIQAVIGTLTGANVVVFRGVSSTTLTDGGTQNPTINDSAVTTKRTGDVYFYGTEEFIWGSDSKWHALGSLDTLGSLAYLDELTASGTFTPQGYNSLLRRHSYTGEPLSGHEGWGKPLIEIHTPSFSFPVEYQVPEEGYYKPEGTVTVNLTQSSNPSTVIKNPTKTIVTKNVVAFEPGTTAPSNNLTYYKYDTNNETLKLYQIGYITGDSITTTDVSVKKGDATYSVSSASFNGIIKLFQLQDFYIRWNPIQNQTITVSGPTINEEGEEVDPGGLTGG